MEETELEYVRICYKAPIIRMIFKEGAELGVPEIRDLIAYSEMLSGKNPYVTLSDVRVKMDVTHEGRRLTLNTKEAPLHKGSAVLVRNGLYQYAATLFSKFDKPGFPYRVFINEQEAVNWLMKLPLV